jgi:hypothetical protein
MNKAAMILMMILTTIFASGCGNRMWESTKKTTSDTYDFMFDTAPTARSYHDAASIPIIELNYQAADTIYSNVGQFELSKHSAIFVRPFTNQNDPSDGSIFGQVVTEQIADRLVQRGVLITDGEPGETDSAYAKGISQADYRTMNSNKLNKLPPRAAMLSGTYVIGDNYIYMAAKVTRLVDKTVISGHNWTLPITDNIRQMLPQLKLDDGLEPSVKTKFN